MIFIASTIAALTVTWCLMLASFAWQDVVMGVVLSTALVGLFGRAIFPRKLPEAEYVAHILLFSPRFFWMLFVDIVKGTWLVAMFVIGVRNLEHPGIVRIDCGNHSPTGVGLVGLLVTISPGSFLVDIDWDERTMLVHYMDASDPDRLRADVEKYYRLWEYGAHLPTAGAGESSHA